MKILQIHTTLRSGGIEAIICGLSNELVQAHDVTVCTIFKPQSSDVFYQKLNKNIHKITLGKCKMGFSLSEIFKLITIIKKGHYDIVHIHGCFYYYALAIWLLHTKTKFIYTIHSDAYKENQIWDQRIFRIKKYFFKHKYMYPVTISPESQRSFKKLYSCDSRIVFNGIPQPIVTDYSTIISALRITSKTKVFIHPGRITEAKNQVVLCKVFQRLIQENEDIVLAIAGLKEDVNIFNMIKPYFSNRIQYLGEMENIPQLMSNSDAFCLPSIWEGLPVTLLEALAVGCIPICSPVGGIVNVIEDKKNGILSKSSTEEDFYNAVKYYLGLSDYALNKMKESCIQTFSNYNIVKTAHDYLKIYNEHL